MLSLLNYSLISRISVFSRISWLFLTIMFLRNVFIEWIELHYIHSYFYTEDFFAVKCIIKLQQFNLLFFLNFPVTTRSWYCFTKSIKIEIYFAVQRVYNHYVCRFNYLSLMCSVRYYLCACSFTWFPWRSHLTAKCHSHLLYHNSAFLSFVFCVRDRFFVLPISHSLPVDRMSQQRVTNQT